MLDRRTKSRRMRLHRLYQYLQISSMAWQRVICSSRTAKPFWGKRILKIFSISPWACSFKVGLFISAHSPLSSLLVCVGGKLMRRSLKAAPHGFAVNGNLNKNKKGWFWCAVFAARPPATLGTIRAGLQFTNRSLAPQRSCWLQPKVGQPIWRVGKR